MNYVVFDAEGADWRSVPQVFVTYTEAREYCQQQNDRYGNSNPWVIRQLIEVAA